MRYPLPWFPLSDGPSRYSCRTTANYRPYLASHVGCRFGRSGSSGFVDVFRLLRWYGCVPVPKGRCCRDRCRYRYIYRPKRIRFPLRGRLKIRNYLRALHLFFAKKIFSSVFLNETISVSIFISISICFSIFKDF